MCHACTRPWRGHSHDAAIACPAPTAPCRARWAAAKCEGPPGRRPLTTDGTAARRASRTRYDLVAGLTPGLSLKNCLLSSMKFFH